MTTGNNLGPPGRERPGPTPETGPIQKSAADTTDKQMISHAGVAESLRRRREASRRVPPLDCGCFDPWLHRCTRSTLSVRMVDAGAQAAQHLLDVGCVPLIELDVVRALWRRGGDDRQLARELFTLAGGDVA